MFRTRTIIGAALAAVLALCGALLVPDPTLPVPVGAQQTPFVWNQDALWKKLEAAFFAARALPANKRTQLIRQGLTDLKREVDSLGMCACAPDNAVFDTLEERFFALSPLVAAGQEHRDEYLALAARLRAMVKKQSIGWDMTLAPVRHRLYRLLYGSRAAVEEVLLQAAPNSVPALLLGTDEPSATPAAAMLGVTIHSGDILVSRDGAPTSALIARGNDCPGNFSHVALVHVDKKFRLPTILESLIERGLWSASLDHYVKDTKLRVMVLRLRAGLPQLQRDPQLPHAAAAFALRRAATEHVPYDFTMDHADPAAYFCSEVATDAYRRQGLELWLGFSRISLPGTMAWLSSFGVRHFAFHEPADLEYDPRLVVVAEWRDPATLYKDHLDNAVIDVMLEQGAGQGEKLVFRRYLLPVARVVKAYSRVLNACGILGPIPQGMSAATALRVKEFNRRHKLIGERLQVLAGEFAQRNGYRPPYWELVKLAQKARAEAYAQAGIR
jgi:hypothetical protein